MFWFLRQSTDNTAVEPEQSIPQYILDAVTVMDGNMDPRAISSSASLARSGGFEAPAEMGNTAVIPQRAVSSETGGAVERKKRGFLERFAGSDMRRAALIALGVAFLVLVIAGGLWYFWLSSQEKSTVSVGFVEEQPVAPAPPVPIVPVLPYAVDSPNYLSLDVETVTPESFHTLLSQAGTKIVSANLTKPIEFFLTDKNNNPLAFNRFAYLMDIELPQDLLASLREQFSLYVYNDNGAVRIGLVMSVTDAERGKGLIMQKESSLPFLFRDVLFRDVSVARELGFRSGVYKADQVRFVNIDSARDISFDYAIRGNDWLIGTSKDTLRSLLDDHQ